MYQSKVQISLRTLNLPTLFLSLPEKLDCVTNFLYSSISAVPMKQFFQQPIPSFTSLSKQSFSANEANFSPIINFMERLFDQLRLTMCFWNSNCTRIQRLDRVSGHLILLIFELFTV